MFIPWEGIEPTYQKQQVISLHFERKKYINKCIYWFKLFILIFTPFTFSELMYSYRYFCNLIN